MISNFLVSLFAWMYMDDISNHHKENPRNFLPFFLGGQKCRRGSSIRTDAKKCFLQFLNFHIQRKNDCLLKFDFFHRQILKIKLSSKQKIQKTSYHFSLANKNANRVWGQGADRGADGGNSLIFFRTFVSRVVTIRFCPAFFSWVGIIVKNALQKKFAKNPSLIFFCRWRCGQMSKCPH